MTTPISETATVAAGDYVDGVLNYLADRRAASRKLQLQTAGGCAGANR